MVCACFAFVCFFVFLSVEDVPGTVALPTVADCVSFLGEVYCTLIVVVGLMHDFVVLMGKPKGCHTSYLWMDLAMSRCC